jgi:signal transduction histidine kinase
MSIQLISLVVAVIANTTLGLVGVYRKPRALRTWLFLLLLLSVNGWVGSTYFLLQYTEPHAVSLWMGLIFAFVTLQNTAYVFFIYAQTNARFRTGRVAVAAYLLYSTLLMLAAVTGHVLARTATGDMPSFGMPFFLLHVLVSVFAGMSRIVRSRGKAAGYVRSQLDYLLFASIVLFTVVPFTNFALPVAFGVRSLLGFSPFFSIIAAGLIAYAMLRHHLFDIRSFIVRAITYIGLTGLVVIFYVVVVLNFGAQLLVSIGLGAYLQLFYAVFTILTAISYAPLERYFRHITNKIFFQEVYETQDVVARLNEQLVRQIETGKLAHRSLEVLDSALKPQYAGIVLNTSKDDRWFIGLDRRRRAGLEDLQAELGRMPQKLIVLDEVEDRTKHAVTRLMDRVDVAMLARLETSDGLIGYMLFGYKVSGNIYTSQDVELATIAADELAVGIQNASRFEEISHFNETLQAQVREATGELRESNKKLKSLDLAKDEFISMASHQLRTPLTSVKGYMSMVLEGDAGKLNPTQHQLLEQAFASSQRMVYLISDFLNVSRLQTGKFTIERTPVILSNVVQQEVNQLKSTAESRNLTIECNVPSDLPALQLDESKLRQAIMNFIDNAIFYSRPRSVIKVDLIKTAKDLALTVQDTGIGVPMSERHHLFTKFYRASNARTARPDGTGIGLFMAKKVVVAHGGSIIFNSVEGKGSTFGFRLPLKQPAGLPEDHPKELR